MRLYEKDAYELSEILRRKQCSAVEILNDVNNRIQETEGEIRAYVTLNPKAEEIAKKVDKAIARGEKLHVLAGIPIAVKDNICTKDMRTTCCSKMLENYVSPYNATVIEKINDAAMIITGKTNMDEFAMGSTTENSYFYSTRNPNNTSYVAGGSSGGSAAAVACGTAILALGSDTGGSVRQPASFCGVIGLKPSYGRVSRYGLVAYASSLDQIGPIGKTVRDVAMLQSLISGYDRYDATSADITSEDLCFNLSDSVKGLRIGIPAEYYGEKLNDEVRISVNQAIKMFEINGAEIKTISLPSTKYAVNIYYIISSAEASSNLARFDGVRYGYRAKKYDDLNDMYERTRSEAFGDEVKRRIMLGTFVLSSDYYEAYYKKASAVREKIKIEFNEAFSECDVIAVPTYPQTAFTEGEYKSNMINRYSDDMWTVSANLAGLPAISIPCGRNKSGMPIGLQLIGRKFDEQTLLNTANAYENICGGFCRKIQIN